jgi:hypothetical protein
MSMAFSTAMQPGLSTPRFPATLAIPSLWLIFTELQSGPSIHPSGTMRVKRRKFSRRRHVVFVPPMHSLMTLQ